MGAACCVAARDRTIQQGPSGEILHRNLRHSPTWSFRWDSRVGVAGEETSIGWLSDVASRNDMLELKSTSDVSTPVADGGSSLENYPTGVRQKSSLDHDSTKNSRSSVSGQTVPRDASAEAKQSTESPQASDNASLKLFSPMHSASSLSISPLSSQSHLLPPSPTPSQWPPVSPVHQMTQQILDNHNLGTTSPSLNSISGLGRDIPAASNESTKGSYGRSSDNWSTYAFSELMSVSQGERWSFDSDSCGWNSGPISSDYQTCAICSKLLTEKSSWSSQKILAGNELSVISVLICGHLYHGECLETITPEMNKYDPACPVCTFGEKQTLKLSRKMLKAERELKARYSKKLMNRVMDTDESFDSDYLKNGANEGRSPKLSTSSSLKISSAKPFLRRHFSFGSRGHKSASENQPSRKKGLFWAKSSRV